MGLFDFLKGNHAKQGFAGVAKRFGLQQKDHKWANNEEKTVAQAKDHKVVEQMKKRDLGVCVPIHAKTPEEKKKLNKKEISPFEKLAKQHASELNQTLSDLERQAPSEPYDFEPELGVESIETKPIDNKRKIVFDEEEQEKKGFVPRKLNAMKPGQRDSGEEEEKYNENDELDVAAKKMDDGYVPRFSSTARQKLGLEEKVQEGPKVIASFEINGAYLGAETMLSGVVVSGTINKRMSCSTGKGNLRISDIKKGSVSVGELRNGESGTIFVRGSAASVRNGDVLDFS